MKSMDIEGLVAWAYRKELPKQAANAEGLISADLARLGYRSAFAAMAEYGKLLAKIDTPTNCYGVVADLTSQQTPHPDAIRIHAAVVALEEHEFKAPGDEWEPFPDGDLGEFGPAATQAALNRISIVGADGVRRLRQPPRHLVFKHAILGGCPEWEFDPPELQYVRGDGGKPKWFVKRDRWYETISGDQVCESVETEVSYLDTPSRRRPSDAYRKHYLDPDPTEAAVNRAEYEIWRAALGVLASSVEEKLRDHKALPPSRPARPWERRAG